MTQLTNMFATVTMPKAEYEKLVRDSEKVRIIERLINTEKYLCVGTVKAVLDAEEDEEPVDENVGYCEKDNTFVFDMEQEGVKDA